jgi:dolichol-phosphate mannosyltransferase
MLVSWWRRFDALPVPPPARFLLVGLSGVGVNVVALWLLLGRLGLPTLPAAALAVETSICSNFLLNDVWTFGAGRRVRPWRARVSAFHAAAAVAAGVNLGLFLLLTSIAGLHYLGADLVAIAVASVINFSISASWIWRARPSLALTSVPEAACEPGPRSKRIVVIPTYNESANIRRLIERILSLGREYETLVVDDSSPDGTGDIVAAMAARESRVHLMRRSAKMGIASAYISGFRMALKLGADLIYQMDGDFSHDPDDLRRLGDAVDAGSVVIGSRYVAGGSTPGWPLRRIVLSRVANRAARILLGIPVRDATGGFKCWSRRVLTSLPLDSVHSSGFAFQIEMNYLSWKSGFSLVEVPITFEDRKAGRSKASFAVGVEMAAVICRLFLSPAAPYAPSLQPSLPKEP